MLKHARVLVIEGDPDAASLFEFCLKEHVGELIFVSTVEEASTLCLETHVIISGERATFGGWRRVKSLADHLKASVLYCTNTIVDGWEQKVKQAHIIDNFVIHNTCRDGFLPLPSILSTLLVSAN